MATLPDIVNWLESDESLHLGRLLVLFAAFAGRSGDQPIEGLTKIAKLDFLLRYPAYFERALLARDAPTAAAEVEEYERNSVEARMVRYRFGPWDHRYRRFLNILIAKRFVGFRIEGRTHIFYLTHEGRAAVRLLTAQPEFQAMRHRATLLKRHFDLKGRNLMEFIYDTFPEVVSLRSGEVIS